MKTSPGLSSPNGARSTRKWCLLGAANETSSMSFVGLEHRPSHGVERLLQGPAVGRRERREQQGAHLVVRLVPGDPTLVVVAPGRRERGGEDAVLGLGQGRVLIGEEPLELRSGRLEHDEVGEPGDDAGALCRDLDLGGAHLASTAYERVVVTHTVDRDPVPGVLLDADEAAVRGGRRLEQPAGEGEGVVLRRGHPVGLGVGERGVLLGVGRQHVGLVPLDVRGREVTAQRPSRH